LFQIGGQLVDIPEVWNAICGLPNSIESFRRLSNILFVGLGNA
jgi:hypothetical protein